MVTVMEKKYFLLGEAKGNVFIRTSQIVLSILCFIIAIYWLVFSFKTGNVIGTTILTVLFLLAFAVFQALSGTGKTTRYIEIYADHILLKNKILRSVRKITADELLKTDIHPLNVIFYFKSGKKLNLRFGTSYQETNEDIKDEIFQFTENNNIPAEFIEEKL